MLTSRYLLVILGFPILCLAVACSSDEGGRFIDEMPAHGSSSEEGVFLRDSFAAGSFDNLARGAVAIGVFEVKGIESVDAAPTRGRFPTLYTTYRMSPVRWIRGEGTDEVLVTKYGAIDPDTGERHFADGSFLFEVGERYLLLLQPKPDSAPGAGTYWAGHGGRGNFQVTDGKVHVLNHFATKDISERFNGMDLDEFVEIVSGLAAASTAPTGE